MRAGLRKIYEIIKKCPRLISIIDATRYPMMPAEYRRVLNAHGNPYVNAGLKKLRALGVFRVPCKARYGKVHIFTEAGVEIKRERCRELRKEQDYYDPGMQASEYRIYAETASSKRRRRIIKAMGEAYESFTQIYRKTERFSFDGVNRSLRDFLEFGIALQKKQRGRYRLNKKGVKIRDFINKADELQKIQNERISEDAVVPAREFWR